MKCQSRSFMLVCLVIFALIVGTAAHAALVIRLEKDVPQSDITSPPSEVTFELYDSSTSATPVATQTFPRGQWWADYDFIQFSTSAQPMVRIKADFTNTAGLTGDMELWVEVRLDGVVKGARERVKKECWAMFSDQALGATTAQNADWAADADMLDGMDSTAFLTGAHTHDGADIVTGTVGESHIDAAIARDSEVMPTVLAGDGSGSGLDADTLDGQDSTAFLTGAHTHDGADITSGTVADTYIAASITRDTEIMPTVRANDGPGSGLDADTIDGVHAAGFVTQAEYDALLARVEALEAKLAYVSVQTGEINGLAGPHVIFSGANVHIRSGSGHTAGALNGLGNLVIGYNEQGLVPAARGGSHNLVVGTKHGYSSYGGLVTGNGNTISGEYASVSGGSGNIASGPSASVSGGQGNTAGNYYASVGGGSGNSAGGFAASVSGGSGNTAGGEKAAVSGGSGNMATGFSASVSGGESNTASNNYASVGGGKSNTADNYYASVGGGYGNEAAGVYSSISGGESNMANSGFESISGEPALKYMSVVTGEINGLAGPHVIFTGVNVHIRSGSGQTDDGGIFEGPTGLGNLVIGYNEQRDTPVSRIGSHNLVVGPGHEYTRYGGLVAGASNTISAEYASVSGGSGNTASGPSSSVSGGYNNTASFWNASVSGGQFNTASGYYSSVSGGNTNTASGNTSSVSAGHDNVADGWFSSVSGGRYNEAGGDSSSVNGGYSNTVSGADDWKGGSCYFCTD